MSFLLEDHGILWEVCYQYLLKIQTQVVMLHLEVPIIILNNNNINNVYIDA